MTSFALGTNAALDFSTYLGGSDLDQVRDLFIDNQGNVYVTGRTASTDFPTTASVFQRTYNGGPQDAFVAKFSRNGQLLFSTYLGGSAYDVGYGIVVDQAGFIYVSGRTSSTNFPVTPGSFQTTYGGGNAGSPPYFGGDFFVAKIKPDGSGIVWGTYIGGSGDDTARGRVALDAAGAVYVEGLTQSPNFPVSGTAVQRTLHGKEDGAVIKLSPDGSQLVYGTYLGGNESLEEGAYGGILVDGNGEAWVIGTTSASDFPTTPNAFQRSLRGAADAFLVRLSADGSALRASTLLGGSGFEEAEALALDRNGNPLLVGLTDSSDLPVTPGTVQTALRGASDAFVVKLMPDLSRPVFFTYLGGSNREDSDASSGVQFDSAQNIWLMITTSSADFPVTPKALQSSLAGGQDIAVIELAPDGSAILFSTYLGGAGNDFGRSMHMRD